MSRVRTINKGYDELFRDDPGTSLTRTAFRRMVVSGKVPSVRVGTKFLIDLDEVETYLRGSVPAAVPVQGIREVRL